MACAAEPDPPIQWYDDFFFILEHYFIYRIKNLTLEIEIFECKCDD